MFKKEKWLYFLILLIMVFILLYIFLKCSNHNDNGSEQWIGNYSFEEFAEPNQNRHYLITIYEDNGLYAHIKIDGFSTLERLTAKVWTHDDEIRLTFYEYYVDEDGNSSILEKYEKGYTLLEMRMEDGVLITEWYLIGPLLIENQEPGQYFTKDE